MRGWLAVPGILMLPLMLHAQQPVTVYIGPAPRADGFTLPVDPVLEESYQDLRKEYAKLKPGFTVVESVADARIYLTLVARDRVPTGKYYGTTAVISGVAVTSSDADTDPRLLAELRVKDTDLVLPLDGRTNIADLRWTKQAKNILKQADAWIQQNRAQLSAAR